MVSTVSVVGIDLGTTNSAIGVWNLELEECELLPNGEGQRLTRSVVAFGDIERPIVGALALDYMMTEPKQVIYSIKRFIGRTFHDKEARRDLKRVIYDLERSKEEKLLVCVGTERFTPVQISAQILRQLKSDAEAALGRSIERAVVTVPAYFNEIQRQATKEAGRQAGLKVAWILSEPTAAALAYGLGKEPEIVAVYDLGGGTFDISIVEIKDGLFRVKAIQGDTNLGGDNFDQAIVKWIKATAEQDGVSLATNDHHLRARLRHKAIEAKIALSTQEEYAIFLDDLYGSEGEASIKVVLTRTKFEELVDELIERTLHICDKALEKAKLPKRAISQVLMVGGQTRMPAIKAKLRERYGWTVNDAINPDEVVAHGAVVMGARLSGYLKEQVKLWDMIPLSLGIELRNGQMETIIKAGKHIPAKSEPWLFTTHRDGQERIRFRIFQGQRPRAKDNDPIGEVVFDLTTPRPKGEHRIECTFMVNAEGILSVQARDADTDEPPVEKKFDRIYQLSVEEKEAIERAAEVHRAEDKITLQLLGLREKLTSRREQSSKMTEDEIKRLDEVEAAIQARDVAQAEALLDEMGENIS